MFGVLELQCLLDTERREPYRRPASRSHLRTCSERHSDRVEAALGCPAVMDWIRPCLSGKIKIN